MSILFCWNPEIILRDYTIKSHGSCLCDFMRTDFRTRRSNVSENTYQRQKVWRNYQNNLLEVNYWRANWTISRAPNLKRANPCSWNALDDCWKHSGCSFTQNTIQTCRMYDFTNSNFKSTKTSTQKRLNRHHLFIGIPFPVFPLQFLCLTALCIRKIFEIPVFLNVQWKSNWAMLCQVSCLCTTKDEKFNQRLGCAFQNHRIQTSRSLLCAA